MPKTDNAVVIDRPLEVVWERMNDLENWPNLYTEYSSVEILEGEGNTVRFRITMHPQPDGQVWSWISERTIDPSTYTSRSRRIETGWFDHMDIEWFFEPHDGGTRMRWVQEFDMKPDAPMTGDQMEDYLNRNTEEQMSIIKQRLEAAAKGE
jgi:aromatase